MSATQNTAGIGPLSGEHVAQLLEAKTRTKPIRKAAAYAGFSGLTVVLVGGALAPFAIMESDTAGMILAAVLVMLGWRELKLRKPLKRLSGSALTGLAANQVLVAIALVAYSVWHLVMGPEASGISVAEANDMTVSEFVSQFRDYAQYWIYVSVIIGAVVFQGAALFFYLSKRSPMASFASECPPWVLDLYRRGVFG